SAGLAAQVAVAPARRQRLPARRPWLRGMPVARTPLSCPPANPLVSYYLTVERSADADTEFSQWRVGQVGQAVPCLPCLPDLAYLPYSRRELERSCPRFRHVEIGRAVALARFDLGGLPPFVPAGDNHPVRAGLDRRFPLVAVHRSVCPVAE